MAEHEGRPNRSGRRGAPEAADDRVSIKSEWFSLAAEEAVVEPSLGEEIPRGLVPLAEVQENRQRDARSVARRRGQRRRRGAGADGVTAP